MYVSSDIQYKHRSDMKCEDLECILIQIRSKGEKDFYLAIYIDHLAPMLIGLTSLRNS